MRSLMSVTAVALLGLTIAAVPAMAKEHPAKHDQATTQPTTHPTYTKHKKSESKANTTHANHHTATTQPAEAPTH